MSFKEVVKSDGYIRSALIEASLAILLTTAISNAAYLQAFAATNVSVTVNTSIPDGVSRLSLGITNTNQMWEYGNPASVARAKKLLKDAASFQNQHIMGWGTDNPQPTPNGPFDFSSLDERVRLMRSVGGNMVITFCTAPGWMKISGKDWDMSDRVADNHVRDFAHLATVIAKRYPDVKYFQIWNEFKGYWDDNIQNSDGTHGGWDYHHYTDMYNALYTAIKTVRPDAEVGGLYLSIGGDGANTLGYTGPGTYTPLSVRDSDALNYWLTHKVGADFICVDYGLKDWFDSNHLTATDGLALTWTYKKLIEDIRGKTNLPLFMSEYYSLPDAIYNGSRWDAAAMASIYYNMIKGEGNTPITALLWDPDQGEEGCPNYLFTDTNSATGGHPTPHYWVYKGMHDNFPPGTRLYKATSSDPNIEVLASKAKTMLINKYSSSKKIYINGIVYTLAPYEVRFITTPKEDKAL